MKALYNAKQNEFYNEKIIHFRPSEFKCPCCGRILVEDELLVKLEILRDMIGRPIFITSGYRCEKYNSKIGGSQKSYHLKGMAADIWVPDLHPLRLYISAVSLQFGGVGLILPSGAIHVDIRQTDILKTWIWDAEKKNYYTFSKYKRR